MHAPLSRSRVDRSRSQQGWQFVERSAPAASYRCSVGGSAKRALWLALLGAGCGAAQAQEPTVALVSRVDEAPVIRPWGATIPYDARPRINLGAVWWSAPRTESLGRLAERWGTPKKTLLALNPALNARERVEQGQRLRVYRHAPGTLSKSVGAPNRGRIENAAAFPLGEGWVMRSWRPRSYATRQVVSELALSLTQWHALYPDAHPVKLGEFSKRGGGRVRPHKSHRSGRDVDVGYVMLERDDGHRFVAVTDDNLDAEATWGLIRQLLASGTVESIFIAESVQEQLLPFAAASMSAQEQQATFSVLEPDAWAKKRTTIKAVRGHDDHMHIRFRCSEVDDECTAARRKKRRRRRRRRR